MDAHQHHTESPAQLAERRGVARRTVYEWISEGLPHEREGGRISVDPSEADDWLAAREIARAAAASGDPADAELRALALRKLQADVERAEARAERERLELEVAEGKLIEWETSQRYTCGLLLALKQTLGFVGRRCASEVVACTRTYAAELRIQREIDAALRAIPDEAWQLIESLEHVIKRPVPEPEAETEPTAEWTKEDR